jgi:DNA repair protein RecO
MRHKYATNGIVLHRTPIKEAGMLVTALTPDLGLVRARAEGVRRSGAKLAHALQTLCESELMLVRGKDGWRLTGAVLSENRFAGLTQEARARIARVAGLVLRLVHGEAHDDALYREFTAFIDAVPLLAPSEAEAAESLVVLRLLHQLGFDAGEKPPEGYGTLALAYVPERHVELIARINRGIAASGA